MGIFLLVVQVLSALPALILAAESIFGAIKGKGAIKKEYVQSVVQAGLNISAATGNDQAAKPEVQKSILAASSIMIDSIVASINAANAWRMSGSVVGSDR